MPPTSPARAHAPAAWEAGPAMRPGRPGRPLLHGAAHLSIDELLASLLELSLFELAQGWREISLPWQEVVFQARDRVPVILDDRLVGHRVGSQALDDGRAHQRDLVLAGEARPQPGRGLAAIAE